MRELVEHMVKKIVVEPDSVIVREIPGEYTSIIEIRVEKDDLGKVIGRNGKTAQSIRNIIYACSFKTGKRYNIDISELE